MRLTFDYDHIAEWKLLADYLYLKHLFGHVEVERSPRRHGFHLIVHGVPPDPEIEHVMRCWFGDDPNRIKFDQESQFKPTRILFGTKWANGRRWNAEPLDERNVLALPFKSKLPKRTKGGFYR